MRTSDFLQYSLSAIRAHRLRSVLTGLGIAVGIANVVVLTSIGEGIHRFVLSEFTQFGTHLISVSPGRTLTQGVPGAILSTVRPLTIGDEVALRSIPGVEATNASVQGNAQVEGPGRTRRTTVLGAGPDVPRVFRFEVESGSFLPAEDDPHASRPFAVLGSTLRRELFGDVSAIGARIRIGGMRFRVVGVLEPKGEFVGFDLDDTVFIPASRALELFNREGLMEINVLYDSNAPVDELITRIENLLLARHGREDFTILTQEKMLDVLGSVLGILTFAVGAIGSISLLVGGVGILTVMTISVTERTGEIGLLRALGSGRGQVLAIFLVEAAALSALGGLVGLAGGISCAVLAAKLLPALPVHISWSYAVLSEALAVVIGLIAGVLPAQHAARLKTVDALRAE